MSPKEKNWGSFKRHYSTNSSNLFGVENNKPIIWDSLEKGYEEIKYKFIGVSGVYRLTNKNDLTRFHFFYKKKWVALIIYLEEWKSIIN